MMQKLAVAPLSASDTHDIFLANTGNVPEYFFRFTDETEADKWVTQAIQECSSGSKIEFTVRDPENQFIGYGTLTLKWLVNWAWENTHASKIIYECDSDNNASVKLAKTLGFTLLDHLSSKDELRFELKK